MAYDEGLAERVNEVMGERPDLTVKKMFGGLCYLINGNMALGITGEDLMIRVGKENYEAALAEPHSREMDFTGKALKGFIYVGPGGHEEDKVLNHWVAKGLDFALSLPPK